jgi:hypothetical protein
MEARPIEAPREGELGVMSQYGDLQLPQRKGFSGFLGFH